MSNVPGRAMSLASYGERYGVSVRCIQNYMNLGAPLDDAPALIVWCGQNNRQVTRKMVIAAGGARPPMPRTRREAVVAADADSYRPEQDEDEEESQAPPLVGVVSATPIVPIKQGLRAELARMETEAAEAYETYRRSNDPVSKAVHFKIWSTATGLLAKISKDLPATEVADNKAVLIADVERIWSLKMIDFRRAIEALPRRISSSMRGMSPAEVEEFVQHECDSVLRQLHDQEVDVNEFVITASDSASESAN